jgi:hypothetical protein
MKEIASAAAPNFSEIIEEEAYKNLLDGVTASCYPMSHADSLLSLCISYPLERVRDALDVITYLERDFSGACAFAADLSGGTLFVHFLSDEGTRLPDAAASRTVETVIRRVSNASAIVLAHKDAATEHLPFISGGGAPAKWAERISIDFHPIDQLNPGLALW